MIGAADAASSVSLSISSAGVVSHATTNATRAAASTSLKLDMQVKEEAPSAFGGRICELCSRGSGQVNEGWGRLENR